MAKHLTLLDRLQDDQLHASSPNSHAALSASAGTGKTHVLTARVLRLLLAGVDPSSILCLTFTKAGAAEMAERIHSRLAHWVQMKDKDLRKELFALDEPNGDKELGRARTLFARVLDASGGGLRIQTIHAFAQSLLGTFPAEASLTPGFRPMEEREEQLLSRQTLAELLVRAEAEGDSGFIRDLQSLSYRLGETAAERFLRRCGRAPEAMDAIGPRQGIEARLRRAFGIPAGDIEEAIALECGDDRFDVAVLRQIGGLNRQWGTKSGQDRAARCDSWLAASATERAALLQDLHAVWAKQGGELRSFARGQAPPDESYPGLVPAIHEHCERLLALRRAAAYVAALAAGLRAGQTFAYAYVRAKRSGGLVDFDDLIRSAETLLRMPGIGEWVRYKLDQQTDHILVDEAQDTNQRQWNIVIALAGEYFAGEGATERRRTIFTVGDYKQAIFGFQGTDPQSFEATVAWFKNQAAAGEAPFRDLSMDRSFRSSPPVLGVVDRLIETIGHEQLGLPEAPNVHVSHHEGRAGSVTLWRPFSIEDIEGEDEAGEEGWISERVRLYAAKLANQIRQWLERPFTVQSKGRPLRPEDILVLVRRRGDLAALLVARLHEEGVPVAGVDRLLLSAPLAVKDLLAAARFVIQPLDDLNLAELLVSPLIGWSQDQLFEAARHRKGEGLWPRLRSVATDQASMDALSGLLAMVDYATPHQFFETILSGPLGGRRKLLARLGPEARDPIEELLSSAIEFEQRGTASLQGFLDWFARGDVEIVRDPSAPLDAVRVMTVHGSKGLQAPVVILADACADPERSGGAGAGSAVLEYEGAAVPILRPRKEELVEPLKSQLQAQTQREREEHWRLLYVAMTRAEERLYIGGSLGAADSNGPVENSWFSAVDRTMLDLGDEWQADVHWGEARVHGSPPVEAGPEKQHPVVQSAPVPAWLHAPAPPEARPPRPLVPSAGVEADLAEPPPSPAMRQAAERGRLLHQLFERMSGTNASNRKEMADRWLDRSVGVEDAGLRAALVADAEVVVSDPRFADFFGEEALAEAPIAAVTADGSVIVGTVDRLLVTDDRVRLVDFKTGRSVPATPADIAIPHLRQMAAYVAALHVIFPGRSVEADLLYTAGPVLHRLEPALLEPYMPGRG